MEIDLMNADTPVKTGYSKIKRILVVEDDPHQREIICQMLSMSGYESVAAENGFEGMEKLQHDQFDLVITDIVLPGKDGIEIILEMKKHNPAIKIIAISGMGKGSFYLESAKDFGADATLLKPFLKKDLLAVIESIGHLNR